MGPMFRPRRRPIARLAAGAGAGDDPPDSYGPAPQSAYLAPPPASTGGEVDELGRLVLMHDNGALSDAEFTAAKAQLLGT
jgi:hypothetical protein